MSGSHNGCGNSDHNQCANRGSRHCNGDSHNRSIKLTQTLHTMTLGASASGVFFCSVQVACNPCTQCLHHGAAMLTRAIPGSRNGTCTPFAGSTGASQGPFWWSVGDRGLRWGVVLSQWILRASTTHEPLGRGKWWDCSLQWGRYVVNKFTDCSSAMACHCKAGAMQA